MAYINEDAVQDIAKVDGCKEKKNSNLERLPAISLSHSYAPTHIQTRTFKDPVIKSTQNKVTKASALTNTNLLTSRSIYTDTAVKAARSSIEEMLAVTLEPSLSGQVNVCACLRVRAVNDRSRVPMRPLPELAGTYGGGPLGYI